MRHIFHIFFCYENINLNYQQISFVKGRIKVTETDPGSVSVWWDSPGWRAKCRRVWWREWRRGGPSAETPEPTRPSWRLEEAPPPAAASDEHLNRYRDLRQVWIHTDVVLRLDSTQNEDFRFWCSNMYLLIREQRHTSVKLIPEVLYEEVESHRASPGLYPGCCRGPRCWGPSRRDRGPVWRGRDGTGPEAADPETNTSTSALSNIKRQLTN